MEPLIPVVSLPSEPTDVCSEQDSVITAGIQEDLLVVAPPGTGKTHTLIERIAYLISHGHVENPREQILVLSFTRSAVAELKKRLLAKVHAGGSGDLLYAQIRTFDSLATNLLRMDLHQDSIAGGYDNRIAQLNELLGKGKLPHTKDALSKVRFLLVDEVQDLNGDRARMVLAIASDVAKSGGCCMFLGDPAQAIYDFEESKDAENAFTSIDFLRKITEGSYSGRSPAREEYSEYRRFETREMLDFVRAARAAMGSNGSHPDGSHLDELLGALGERTSLSSVPALVNPTTTTAILTRNNLEAYWICDWLTKRGIEADLWRGAGGSYWPGWIGRLFLGFQGEWISIEKARQRWEKHVAAYTSITFEEAVCFLEKQGLSEPGAGTIQLGPISDHLLNGSPVNPQGNAKSRIVISTVHRSKGLEFDDVLLLSPSGMDGADEIRIVYVAATRAKRKFRVLERDSQVIRKGNRQSRSLKTSGFHIFSYPKAPRIGLLVDGYDVIDPDSILSLEEPLAAQKRLWEECAGRPRTMEVIGLSATVSGNTIGQLSRKYAGDIGILRRCRGVPNSGLDGLQVVDLATVSIQAFGNTAEDELGTARLAIVPVVTGVASI
ncbi:UvrD-helicase domain-containing protein [Dyella humicola]|uniref:UvrD-helicase domain-containing protein n=1 Tax=Dyella humicola TaxID=2992126 RepID=UPI002251F520|nr:UvrD-helicase domain-containing protein [Dyella humicola]